MRPRMDYMLSDCEFIKRATIALDCSFFRPTSLFQTRVFAGRACQRANFLSCAYRQNYVALCAFLSWSNQARVVSDIAKIPQLLCLLRGIRSWSKKRRDRTIPVPHVAPTRRIARQVLQLRNLNRPETHRYKSTKHDRIVHIQIGVHWTANFQCTDRVHDSELFRWAIAYQTKLSVEKYPCYMC